jgi:hypothetical protein
MPANGMAQTPGVSNANSATAKAVLQSPFSGPTGSPFAAQEYPPSSNTTKQANASDTSVGALSTGIGFGMGTATVINVFNGADPATPPGAIGDKGFTDDYQPGISLPSGASIGNTAPVAPLQTPYGAVLTAIGGGASGAAANGIAPTTPYVAVPLLGFGNGGTRDAGAGPAFTGFGEKMVTATGAVAVGAAIEAGFVNRTYPVGGPGMVATESAFGSATAASPAPTIIP